MLGISWLAYALLALGLATIALALFAPSRPGARPAAATPRREEPVWDGPVRFEAPAPEAEGSLHEEVHALLERALRSPRVAERMLAVEYADLLDDRALLDAALADEELGVAAAAIYALRSRMNGSLWPHVRSRLPEERAEQLAGRLRLLK